MKFLIKNKLTLIGLAIGSLGGYAYYYFIGCTTGSCPITSQPVNSSVYGAIMGALLTTSLKKKTT